VGSHHHLARLTVLYDGDCGICTRSAHWAQRLDWRDRLDCVPLQSVDAVALGLDPEALMIRLHVIDDGHQVVGVGWDAIVEICRRLPLLAWVPLLDRGPIRRGGLRRYDEVAARRQCADPGARS